MADNNATKTEKTAKPDFFKGLKAEFKKIVWPNKDTLTKQTIAVVSITIALSLIIAILDFVLQYGLNFIIK